MTRRRRKVATVDTVVTFANIPSTANHRQIQAGFDLASHGTHVLITVEDHMRRSADFLGPEWLSFQAQGHQRGRCSVHLLDEVFNIRGHDNPLLNRANGMRFPGATRYGQVVRTQDVRSGRYPNWGASTSSPTPTRTTVPACSPPCPAAAPPCCPRSPR